MIKLAIFLNFILTLGGWKCVTFELELQLTTGERLQGFYTPGNYTDHYGIEFDSLNFLKAISIGYPLELYKEPDTLKFPDWDINPLDSCGYQFIACEVDNIKKIQVDEIRSIRYIDKYPCSTCSYEFGWNGMSPQIIKLRKFEIEQLKNFKPIFSENFQISEYEFSTFFLVSYQEALDKSEIQKFILELQENQLPISDIEAKARDLGVIFFRIDFVA